MPFAISAICWYQYPKLFGGKQNSRTDLGNVLPSSWKLNRIPRKCIQMLVDICGRAHLSRNSLLGCVFIDLKSVENSASLSEGLRQPSHFSWIGRRQCCLTLTDFSHPVSSDCTYLPCISPQLPWICAQASSNVQQHTFALSMLTPQVKVLTASNCNCIFLPLTYIVVQTAHF